MSEIRPNMAGLPVKIFSGFYRISCEVTMKILRDNKDSIMSVLDAFIHDPLVEWEEDKRNLVRISRALPRTKLTDAYRPAGRRDRTPMPSGHRPTSTRWRTMRSA